MSTPEPISKADLAYLKFLDVRGAAPNATAKHLIAAGFAKWDGLGAGKGYVKLALTEAGRAYLAPSAEKETAAAWAQAVRAQKQAFAVAERLLRLKPAEALAAIDFILALSANLKE